MSDNSSPLQARELTSLQTIAKSLAPGAQESLGRSTLCATQRTGHRPLKVRVHDHNHAQIRRGTVDSSAFNEHLAHLEALFKVLRFVNIRINSDKSVLEKVTCLGCTVPADCSRLVQDRIETIQAFSKLTNYAQFWRFLGLANLYRRCLTTLWGPPLSNRTQMARGNASDFF